MGLQSKSKHICLQSFDFAKIFGLCWQKDPKILQRGLCFVSEMSLQILSIKALRSKRPLLITSLVRCNF